MQLTGREPTGRYLPVCPPFNLLHISWKPEEKKLYCSPSRTAFQGGQRWRIDLRSSIPGKTNKKLPSITSYREDYKLIFFLILTD
jgi:hypothetical protein